MTASNALTKETDTAQTKPLANAATLIVQIVMVYNAKTSPSIIFDAHLFSK